MQHLFFTELQGRLRHKNTRQRSSLHVSQGYQLWKKDYPLDCTLEVAVLAHTLRKHLESC